MAEDHPKLLLGFHHGDVATGLECSSRIGRAVGRNAPDGDGGDCAELNCCGAVGIARGPQYGTTHYMLLALARNNRCLPLNPVPVMGDTIGRAVGLGPIHRDDSPNCTLYRCAGPALLRGH